MIFRFVVWDSIVAPNLTLHSMKGLPVGKVDNLADNDTAGNGGVVVSSGERTAA
jgi:hypothetical protein